MKTKVRTLEEVQTNLRHYGETSTNPYGSITGTNWSTGIARFIPLYTINGEIYCFIIIAGTTSSGASSLTLTISGVTFESTSATSLSAHVPTGYAKCKVNGGAETILIESDSSNTNWRISGFAFLSELPDFAVEGL